ncbi:amidohydrolase family protein [Cellulomonas sp. ACRRI]|uniref:metal-dependent hydrolase family protein n=1 Tax=Cellulomonas sp. ACRRI TaxID=2918188 RepID=UPI001EF34115|nr:amidohydrolase family protein [Cellulomonas sp. ACRRI]MCG7288401.1 amidohydrolase family protein [Cellulomonas sp. ACRRI]
MTDLLLRDVRLIDGTGTAPRPGTDVLVSDGVIAAVGPAGTVVPGAATADPARLAVLDGAGRTLLPGFLDCHVHVSTSPGGDTLGTVLAPESLLTLRSVPHLSATLDAGVTTARDLAGADSGFRDALEQGLVRGPRLQVAIRILSITGGHGDWRTIEGVALDTGPGAGAVADSPAEFVRAVREVLRQGADWVKVAATGGMGSPRSHPESGGLSEPELRAVVEEADRHGGVGVAAHAQGAAGIAAAVRAGVRSVEHGYLVDDATIDLMGERGTWLVPTLSTLTRPVADGVAPWVAAKRRALTDTARERLHAAISAGVPVALGTDAGIAPHGTNLTELALLVEHGLSPAAALVAGTSGAARMLGIADQVGTVAPGLRADLVLTDVDPLTSIDALADPRNVRVVVQDGRVVKDARADDGRTVDRG